MDDLYTSNENHCMHAILGIDNEGEYAILLMQDPKKEATQIIMTKNLLENKDNWVCFLGYDNIDLNAVHAIDNAVSVCSSMLGFLILLKDASLLSILKKEYSEYYLNWYRSVKFSGYSTPSSIPVRIDIEETSEDAMDVYPNKTYLDTITNIMGCKTFFGIFCGSVLFVLDALPEGTKVYKDVLYYVYHTWYMIFFNGVEFKILGKSRKWYDTTISEFNEYFRCEPVEFHLSLYCLKFRITDRSIYVLAWEAKRQTIVMFGDVPCEFKADLESLSKVSDIVDIHKMCWCDVYAVLLEDGTVYTWSYEENENGLRVIHFSDSYYYLNLNDMHFNTKRIQSITSTTESFIIKGVDSTTYISKHLYNKLKIENVKNIYYMEYCINAKLKPIYIIIFNDNLLKLLDEKGNDFTEVILGCNDLHTIQYNQNHYI